LIRRGLFDSAARERVCAKQASPLIASPMSAFTASSPPSSAATSTACSRPAVRARDRTGHWMTTIRLPPMSAAASSSSLRSGSVTDPAFIALRPRGQRTAARLRVARLYSCHRSRSRVSPVCSVSPTQFRSGDWRASQASSTRPKVTVPLPGRRPPSLPANRGSQAVSPGHHCHRPSMVVCLRRLLPWTARECPGTQSQPS
jgi:hypothetical protein